MDPISEYLKNYFDRLPEFIIALNYDHCRYACRQLNLPVMNSYVTPKFISTSDYSSVWKLRATRLRRDQVYVYETACDGGYYNQIMYYLEICYVD